MATVAYLARCKGTSRMHTESDLRIFLGWCTEWNLKPLSVQRAQVELYFRWLQEIRRFRPSTVSRRLSVVAGFYRICVIDGCWSNRPPTMSAVPTSHPSRRLSSCRICSSRHCCPRHASLPIPTTSPWSRCSASSDYGSSKPPEPISTISARNTAPGTPCRRQGRPGRPGAAPTGGRPGLRHLTRAPRRDSNALVCR
jgi:hypothetical protein